MPPLNILYEDNHLLVVNKPAGIPTMGAASGTTVHSLAAAYLKEKYAKPGKVFIGIVSRLDSMTSGVLVLARTSKAASRLSQQFRDSKPQKRYLAIIHGVMRPAEAELRDWIYKDEKAHRMRCAETNAATGKKAALRYQTLDRWSHRSLLLVDLLTGRKHQIRSQLSAAGHPIWGDRKYDAPSRMKTGIALHSCELTIEHPTRKEPMTFRAPPPKAWVSLGVEVALDRWLPES